MGSYSLIGTEGLTGSSGFAVLRPVHRRYIGLVYLAVTDAENVERLAFRADGAAYPAVRPEVVVETEIVLPNTDHIVIDRFAERIAPLLDKMETNKKQNRAVAALRDELLPKLVSGELRVEDVTRFTGNQV